MVMHQGQSTTFSDAALTDEQAKVESEGAPNRRLKAPNWLAILWQNRKSRAGLIILAGFFLVAIFAPLIAPYDPHYNGLESNLGPSSDHLLGTTTRGEDIFSQIVYGARTSLIVGILGGLLATAIALVVGMTAGYLQGLTDEVLSFFINLGLVIPVLPLIAVL